MFPALLTVALWAVSAVCANRSVRLLGTFPANLARLGLAGLLLAIWAHWFGSGLKGASLWWFVFSGCVGFGLGDIGLFEALPRIRPRLTIMLCQCLAAPVAALVEWACLRTALTLAQILIGMVILGGVAMALTPSEHPHVERRHLVTGTLFGVMAALGLALGAVMSRKAYQVAAAASQVVDGGTAAYQRVIGGLVVIAAFYVIVQIHNRRKGIVTTARWREGWPWIVANALTGPTIGVSCFQWALATTPSGIVLPIVAITPLAVIPLAYLMEGDRPSRRSLVGGVVAVAGVVALTLAR